MAQASLKVQCKFDQANSSRSQVDLLLWHGPNCSGIVNEKIRESGAPHLCMPLKASNHTLYIACDKPTYQAKCPDSNPDRGLARWIVPTVVVASLVAAAGTTAAVCWAGRRCKKGSVRTGRAYQMV